MLLLCDARTLAAVRAASRRMAALVEVAMSEPLWAWRHSLSLSELLWLAPPPALRLALRRVWASHGVPADLADALPHACSHVPSSRRAKILSRLGVSVKAHAVGAGAENGSLRPGARGSLRRMLLADSSSDSDSETECAFHEFPLHERASRRPQPSPGDPSTHIVLQLSPGSAGDWAGQATSRAAGGWAILKETRYRDTRLQKALCGFEPQTTRHARPREASWHSRSCRRHPLRSGDVRAAEWRADPDGAAARAWRDELDYDCCCHIDWP
jgi:hypothetical protein